MEVVSGYLWETIFLSENYQAWKYSVNFTNHFSLKIEKIVFGMKNDLDIGVNYSPSNTDINTFSDQFAFTIENIKRDVW